MGKFKYYFTTEYGGNFPREANVRLGEVNWNTLGHYGNFRVEFRDLFNRRDSRSFRNDLRVRIGRIDGQTLKYRDLSQVYNEPCEKISREFLTFPNLELCIALFLNFSYEDRKQIAENLNFNFAEGDDFATFQNSELYKKVLLRSCTEAEFIMSMQYLKDIYFSTKSVYDFIKSMCECDLIYM